MQPTPGGSGLRDRSARRPIESPPPFLRPLAAALGCLLLASCTGSGLVKTTGQLVADGADYPLAAGETAQVTFATADGAYPPLLLTVPVKADGRFAADMNDGTGNGLRPGKYKVSMDQEATSIKSASQKLYKSSMLVDVQSATAPHLVIDIRTSTITAK